MHGQGEWLIAWLGGVVDLESWVRSIYVGTVVIDGEGQGKVDFENQER